MQRFVLVALGALVLAPAAAAGTVTLYPTGFRAMAFTDWRAQEGLPDSTGGANQALKLEKDTFDVGPTAAAVISGVEGARVDRLTGLNWERRVDGDCGVDSPRWTVGIRGRSGKHYLVRFGCRVSIHSAGSAPGWMRDTNPQPLIRARVLALGPFAGKDAFGGLVESLAIVFDKRQKFGYVFLDNIQVLSKQSQFRQTWTSAADNGNGPPPSAGPDDLTLNPFTDVEQLTFEELWPLLSPEDQALAASDADAPPDQPAG